MSAILLKNVPPGLHARLKRRAKAERHSLAHEAILVLECGLGLLEAPRHNHLPPPVPIKTKFQVTNAFLAECKRERDARTDRLVAAAGIRIANEPAQS
jgi:plasmid stability protein